MNFSDSPRRRPEESIVPMINVVFLLLVFFLMTAQIAPPEPFEVTRPTAVQGSAATGEEVLFVDQDGALAYRQTQGQNVFVEIEKNSASIKALQVKADSKLEAVKLAEIMRRLAHAGLRQVDLVVDAP